MMDNTGRGCVTFGEVAWIQQNQQIQQEVGLSDKTMQLSDLGPIKDTTLSPFTSLYLGFTAKYS